MAKILETTHVVKISLHSIGTDVDNPNFTENLSKIIQWLNINVDADQWNCYEKTLCYWFVFADKIDAASFSLIWERYDI